MDNNNSDQFMVLFMGEFRHGITPTALKDAIANIFNASIIRIDKLFCGRPVVIKNNLIQDEAETYRNALISLGAVSWIEPMPPYYRKYSDRRKKDRTRRATSKERTMTRERRSEAKRGRRYQDQ